jgi:hypothetical protein
LADERDLGSRGAIRVGSSPTFPIGFLEQAGVVQLVERLLAKEKVVGSNPIARFSICTGLRRGPVVLFEFSRFSVFVL